MHRLTQNRDNDRYIPLSRGRGRLNPIMRCRFHVLLIIVIPVFVLPVLLVQADPLIESCQVFPADNPWNTDISAAPIHPNSAKYIANINAHGGDTVHPDFGSDPEYGIPYITVPGTQPKVPVTFYYDDESDPGPYPIPADAPVEGGGDRHVIVIDTDNCILYETYNSEYVGGAQHAWTADSGAIFDLSSNALRPDGWTSADAAGLPIFPGLARCDEVMSGEIKHALRFTVNETQRAYIYPATHFASDITDPNYPPMGLRVRLKANYDLSDMTGQALVIATALKHYGMILADNGSNWYISGERDQGGCWDDDDLDQLKDIPGTAFEVIQSVSLEGAAPNIHYYTTHTPTLTWTRISWATGYEVQVSLDRSFSGSPIYSVPANSQAYTPAPLANGTYYWRVRGMGGGGMWSPIDTFIVNA